MPQTGLKQQKSSKKQGPRPKHVPQRTCIVCRDTSAKRTLTRIVRTEEGQIEVDPTGRMNGRGAYLCDKQTCWERAVATPILAKALKTNPTPESIIKIREFAAGAPLRTDDGAPTAGPKEKAL